MRPTTAPEAVLRRVCRRLRAEGARVSIYAVTETNGLAVGSWPGVCGKIALVLEGEARRIQVQAGPRTVDLPLGPDVAGEVVAAVRGEGQRMGD